MFAAVEWPVRRTTSPTRSPAVIHEPAAATMVFAVVVIEVSPAVACVTATAATHVPRSAASRSGSNVPADRSPT